MTTTHIETPETPAEAESLVGVANDALFGTAFAIRSNILNLTMEQWKIADSLELSSITPAEWIKAIGSRGGFLTGLMNDDEREFVRIVYLPNKLHTSRPVTSSSLGPVFSSPRSR